MGTIKKENGRDLVDAEEIKRDGKSKRVIVQKRT